MKLLRKLFCLGAVAVAGAMAAQTSHPYTSEDWAKARSAAPDAVSPDGAKILYSVAHGGESGPTQREFWTIAPDGSGAAKLETPKGFSPEGYMADGKALYGEFQINGKPQLAVFDLAAGKVAATPRMVVVLGRGVEAIVPSPDGGGFALLADPRPEDEMAATRTVVEPGKTSLYLVRADGTGGRWACAEISSISGGEGSATPPIAWSEDSHEVAVIASWPKIGHHAVRSEVDLCPAAVGAKARQAAVIENSVSSVAFAGKDEIAVLSTPSPTLTPDHLYTIPATGGPATDRTPALDTTLGALEGDGHGHLFVLVQQGVKNEVAEWNSGVLKTLYRWPEGVVGLPVSSPYHAATSQMAFAVGDPSHASNVATLKADDGLERVTTEGDAELKAVALGTVRVVDWTTKDGMKLEGIATFPAGYVEGKRYPFLVLPHGGPEANDELRLDPFARTVAGLGYVVLQPEYRGSTGYGDAHMAAIYQHFGDRAYQDVDSATDFAIAQGWADPQRLAIFGWSAGGFMTSWTVTQTGRYKAAIEGAGITDWGSFIFTSDVGQIDFDARWPEEDPEAFRRFSAVEFAKNVTTPLLILHGEQDVRVPTYQGREFYEVLAARAKTVRMVTYPGSGHFPGLWQQRLNVMHEVTEWLAKYNPAK